MLTFDIPGRSILQISSVVLDYNGTIARDGQLLPEAARRIVSLRELVDVSILTADTHGTAQRECAALGVTVRTFPRAGAAECKRQIVQSLDGQVAAIGNGFNDIQMFDTAALSIAVLEQEGMCGALLSHADVLVRSAKDALDLLLLPDRLRATLRT